MPVRLVFRCQFCDRRPEPLTQHHLERVAREILVGEYLDAIPERWLVWTGRGPYGPRRYACPDHRGDLIAELREHYGVIGPHPWKMGPYPSSLRTPDHDQIWPPSKFELPGVAWAYRRQQAQE
ncbi:MAG: hypothetical protein M3296_03840 [Actinomycetota bacterium]|nr:hypothetical protein [Actinomycetota bacterium]